MTAKQCGFHIRMLFIVKLLNQEGGLGFVQFVELSRRVLPCFGIISTLSWEKLPPKQRFCLN